MLNALYGLCLVPLAKPEERKRQMEVFEMDANKHGVMDVYRRFCFCSCIFWGFPEMDR